MCLRFFAFLFGFFLLLSFLMTRSRLCYACMLVVFDNRDLRVRSNWVGGHMICLHVRMYVVLSIDFDGDLQVRSGYVRTRICNWSFLLLIALHIVVGTGAETGVGIGMIVIGSHQDPIWNKDQNGVCS
jgi:hypothetical protein